MAGFCTKCGAPLASTTGFCNACGTPIAAAAPPQPPVVAAPPAYSAPPVAAGYPPQNAYPPPKSSGGALKIILIIVAVVVVIGLGVVGVVGYGAWKVSHAIQLNDNNGKGADGIPTRSRQHLGRRHSRKRRRPGSPLLSGCNPGTGWNEHGLRRRLHDHGPLLDHRLHEPGGGFLQVQNGSHCRRGIDTAEREPSSTLEPTIRTALWSRSARAVETTPARPLSSSCTRRRSPERSGTQAGRSSDSNSNAPRCFRSSAT